MSNSTADGEVPFLYARKGGILTPEMGVASEDVFTVVVLLLGPVGIVTNSLNIKAFLVIGKESGISVSLLSLSISDLGYCTTCFGLAATIVFRRIEKSYDYLFPLDPWVPSAFINQISNAFLAMTVMTTTFLAVTRCMCVVKPLQFSNTFTRSRSIVIHTCIAIFCLGGYIPVMTEMRAKKAFNELTNQTRYVLWLSDKRADAKDATFFIFDTVFAFTVQVVLIICVSIMTNSLRKSVRFRQANKAKELGDGAVEDTQNFKLSGKELQVIIQLVIISSIFIICSLPRVISATYSLIEPEFEIGKGYHYFYMAVSFSHKIFDLVNSSSTFWVYFSYNSRFMELYRGPKDKN